MKRYGIFGGSFNPPHLGHLIVIDSVRDQLLFDKIVFVPASTPPHKIAQGLAPAVDRYEMVTRSIEQNANFLISDIEIQRKGFSYTIDTIKELQTIYPLVNFSLIIGADNYIEIETWKSLDEIVQNVELVVMTRPEYPTPIHHTQYLRLAKFVSVPNIGISSTDIRRRIKQGRSIRYLVPESVEKYIYQKGLYRE